jgi:hypothetical protein
LTLSCSGSGGRRSRACRLGDRVYRAALANSQLYSSSKLQIWTQLLRLPVSLVAPPPVRGEPLFQLPVGGFVTFTREKKTFCSWLLCPLCPQRRQFLSAALSVANSFVLSLSTKRYRLCRLLTSLSVALHRLLYHFSIKR